MIYLTLFLEFFKIGLFTFGGGYAMIPLVKELVLKYSWLTEAEFYDFLGVCESTPGPIAVNMATYVGNMNGGVLGSVLATLGVVLPSFLIILLIAAVLKNLTENKFFKGFIFGVKPVVIALIASTGASLLVKRFFVVDWGVKIDFVSVICFSLICAVYFLWQKFLKKKPSAIMLILISAVLGIILSLIFG